MKILNFGSCNIDFVYNLDHIVSIGETEESNVLAEFPGGKGLNQSIALARAGADVYHAGCIGNDGEMLYLLMKENNIDVSNVKRVDERNGHAIIQVSKKGENSIFLYPGSNYMITKEFVNSVLSGFSKGDIIVLQNEINMVDYIVKEAYKKEMTIVFNPSPCNEKIKEIDFSCIDYLLFNEVEGEMLSNENEPKKIISYFNENYPHLKGVLTLGKSGSVFFDKKTQIFQPAFVSETVDTTAAGDTFTGYFIANIEKGETIEKSLKIASLAAAISVSKKGASPSIPYYDDVISKIDTVTAYKKSPLDTEQYGIINNYIEKNLKNSTLNDLANLLGYSVSHTQNIVNKLYNKSFSKVVQEKCCVVASLLLKETDMPIGEIIEKIGYENESFFRNLFKEKYGKNMLEYRKYIKGERN